MDIPADPWGENKTNHAINDENLCFEDSFTDCSSVVSQEKKYVPLDDSEKYLIRLENKLACIQGKTLSQRESESKRLVSDLAKSREDHAVILLSFSTKESVPSNLEESQMENQSLNKGLSILNAVNPQGALGLAMRKCAPNLVALSAEELCELLKADILAKVHEELHTEKDNNSGDAKTEIVEHTPYDDSNLHNSIQDT